MSTSTWETLIESLFDEHSLGGTVKIPGADICEWLSLAKTDYDDIDRDIIETETNGA
jgi:hypothetical protein